MIEKLHWIYSESSLAQIANQKELEYKINEIIEAINPILEERESGIKVYEETMEMVKQKDPYAEQKKWIGKVCWFWDNNPDKRQLDILIDIGSGITPYETDTSYYQNCEPVSPEDDIIFKGE